MRYTQGTLLFVVSLLSCTLQYYVIVSFLALKMELLFYFMGLNWLVHMRPEVCAADRFISEWFRQSSAAKAEQRKHRGRRFFEASCFVCSALLSQTFRSFGGLQRRRHHATHGLCAFWGLWWQRLCLAKMISPEEESALIFVHNDEKRNIWKALGVETCEKRLEMKSSGKQWSHCGAMSIFLSMVIFSSAAAQWKPL